MSLTDGLFGWNSMEATPARKTVTLKFSNLKNKDIPGFSWMSSSRQGYEGCALWRFPKIRTNPIVGGMNPLACFVEYKKTPGCQVPNHSAAVWKVKGPLSTENTHFPIFTKSPWLGGLLIKYLGPTPIVLEPNISNIQYLDILLLSI